MRRRRRSSGFSLRTPKRRITLKNISKNALNWVILIFVAAVLGYAVVTFGIQTVQVMGPSMKTTLEDGQTVLVNKLIYNFNDVKRFDVVAYSILGSEDYYDIKRVVGLPGETVYIKDGNIYINNELLAQTKIDENILNAGIAAEPIVLDEDEYFLLGDNVNNSEDSRFANIGNITDKEILGKVIYVINPKTSRGKVQ